jgi:hypothetical protein
MKSSGFGAGCFAFIAARQLGLVTDTGWDALVAAPSSRSR